ncbi:hypothetical protein [Brochothrix thermosphacta]|uniref:hypothetical protein n=1 Tax=Brochothrix thermosphacta TaxID=2756 RepID=UPI00159F06CC|nr:hypothetical protein [Brochothrix thermosphacta]
MNKIKTFNATNPQHLDIQINEFLFINSLVIENIEFSATVFEGKHFYHALIIYKKEVK